MDEDQDKVKERKEEREGKITIAVRGVDEDLYRRVSALAKETGRTIGELINESMKLLLSVASTALEKSKELTGTTVVLARRFSEGLKEGFKEAEALVISDVEELNLTRKDLEEVSKPIILKNIKKLSIDDDVPYELFKNKVLSITFCDEVSVPSSYPKLEVLSICRMVKKLTFKNRKDISTHS